MKTLATILVAGVTLAGCDKKEEAPAAGDSAGEATATGGESAGAKGEEPASKGEPKTDEPAKPAVEPLAPGAMPFEFPVVEATGAKAGERVFAVNMKLIRNALDAGKKSFQTQYLVSTMGEPGAKASKVKFVSMDTVPNSGIVRIPPGATAKKGDIVAGVWAVNMTRGIVVDAKDPKQPKAVFIGLAYDNPAKGPDKKTGIGQFAYPLKEGEFVVIANDFDPASACALKQGSKYKLMTVFRAEGDQVMGTVFTSFKSVPKADCVPLPLRPKYKKGASVWAPWVGTMSKGKITKVGVGRYKVKFDESSKGEKMISFGEVIDALP